jgi:hypothetical protein
VFAPRSPLLSGTTSPHGGWYPVDRRAEDGPIGPQYELTEIQTRILYGAGAANVREADVTVIFNLRPTLTGGGVRRRQDELLGRKVVMPWCRIHRRTHSSNCCATVALPSCGRCNSA